MVRKLLFMTIPVSIVAFGSSEVVGAEFPAELSSSVSFWFEGNSNVITNDQGGVLQWWDCRESAYVEGEDLSQRKFSNRRAMAYLPEPANEFSSVLPTLYTDETRFPGKRFVDFGELGSGKWLGFSQIVTPPQTCATMISARSKVGAYFAVVGFCETAGEIVSDVQNYTKKGNKAFFRQSDGSGKGAISTTDIAYSVAFLGETRIDGRRVDPCVEGYRLGDFQIVTQNGPGDYKHYSVNGPAASTLFNYSNASGQQGGGILGELIAFTRALTDEERRAVEKYLAIKWFGTEFASELNVNGSVDVTGSKVVDRLSGDGTLTKKGDGKLTSSFQGETPNMAIKLEGGELQLDQKREPVRLLPTDGKRVTLSNGVYSVSEATPDRFEFASADGNAFLLMTADDLAVSNLSVSGASLALGGKAMQAAFAEAGDLLANSGSIVVNGGFEVPAIDNGEWDDIQEYSDCGWTSSGVANTVVLARKGSAIFEPTNGAYVVEGSQVLGVHPTTDKGVTDYYSVPMWAEQTVTAPFDGLYELTFWMTRRPGANRKEGANNTRGEIFIDGERVFYGAVSTDHRSDQDFFKQFAVDVPLSEGTHVLRLAIFGNNAKNRAVLYDDVRLRPIKKGVFAKIPNPGFESTDPVNNKGANGWYVSSPSEASWKFVNGTGDRSIPAGITQHSTWWSQDLAQAADALRDYRKAFLHNDDYVTNTIVVPKAGKYVFSMRFSNRCSYPWNNGCTGSARASGHALAVSVDGTEIGRAYPVSQLPETYKAVCTLSEGEHELKIAGMLAFNEDGTQKETTSVIDDIRLQLYEDTDAILKESDFLDGFNGAWTACGEGVASVEAGIVTLGPGGEVAQTITVPSNGYYFAEFSAYGMTPELTSSNGVYNGTLWYPQEIAVKVDGRTVGTARPENDVRHRYTFSLGYLAGGSHAFSLVGTESAGEKARSYLTDAAIRPLSVTEAKAADFNLEKASWSLDGNSRLDLQFFGSVRLGELRINGSRVSGVFSVATQPDWVSGQGEIVVRERGTVIMLR